MIQNLTTPTARRLRNLTRQNEIAGRVESARTLWQRTRGLLGRASLPAGEALWIHGSEFIACNSIHTFFMRFAIDVIFVDRELKVRRTVLDLQPWRMTLPALGAHSVFELPAGTLRSRPVEPGDQLYVGD